MPDTGQDFYTIGPLPEFTLGPIAIPTYYAWLSLTFCLGIFWFYKRCESKGLSAKKAMDMVLVAIIAGFFGARLFHILLEMPAYYYQYPIEVFYFWQGGFVFYGGFLSGYLASLWFIGLKQKELWKWHDAAAPVLAGCYSLGRVACFLVGCCYGRHCEWPWGIGLKQMDPHSHVMTTVLRHPTQLYATLWEAVVLALLLLLERKTRPQGQIFLIWLFLHAFGRLGMELFRDDPRGGTLLGLSVSTVISVLLMVYVLVQVQIRKQNHDNQR